MTTNRLDNYSRVARQQWHEAVAEDNTMLGYEAWCRHQLIGISEDDGFLTNITLTANQLRILVNSFQR